MKDNAFVADIKGIITDGMRNAYRSVHAAALMTYWRVGRRIVEEEQAGEARAQYGRRLLAGLSAELLVEFGESYSERNLRSYRQFYRLFPDFEIWNARVPNLTWTHFRALLPVASDDARYWYMREADEHPRGACPRHSRSQPARFRLYCAHPIIPRHGGEP